MTGTTIARVDRMPPRCGRLSQLALPQSDGATVTTLYSGRGTTRLRASILRESGTRDTGNMAGMRGSPLRRQVATEDRWQTAHRKRKWVPLANRPLRQLTESVAVCDTALQPDAQPSDRPQFRKRSLNEAAERQRLRSWHVRCYWAKRGASGGGSFADQPVGSNRKASSPTAADFAGFSLKASVAMSALNKHGRERLLRYCAHSKRKRL
jgi:hypothetical protein